VELDASRERLRRAMEGTLQSIVLTIEKRDPYTTGHQRRVARLAAAIAREAGLTDGQADCIRMAAGIHDVGKMHVPAEIIGKPGRVTDVEFELIKIHPQAGHEILRNVEFPWPVADIVLQHHERMDGSGYPAGKTGGDILVEARVLAVADVVEAMTAHRPYRAALSVEEAIDEIVLNRGTLFDSRVVDACVQLINGKKYKIE
jgi:putative nucleotidyltransferase with HDIG domain